MSRPGQAAPLPDLLQQPLSSAEVVELWSFVHGDIMEPGIRELLRAGQGLCRRHTWGYAATEIELWQAGPRGGHQPFDVAVLYEDLCDHVAARLDHPGLLHHDRRHILLPTTSCYICQHLPAAPEREPGTSQASVGYGGVSAVTLTDEVHALTHTRERCRNTESHWLVTACPVCVEAVGTTDDGRSREAAMVCRLHLQAAPLEAAPARQVADGLRRTAERLRGLTRSLSAGGQAPTPEQEASWVEALGWFAGWAVPLSLTTQPDGDPGTREEGQAISRSTPT